MTSKTVSSDKEKLLKRPWYRLHLSTWGVILLLVGFFAIVEIPGDAPDNWPYSRIFIFNSVKTLHHGWPCDYLTRSEDLRLLNNDTIETPWLTPRAWNVFAQSQRQEFSLSLLALDLAVSLAIIFILAGLFEWRRRNRTRLFQFTLRELLLLTLFIAGGLSWWRVHHNQRIHELKFVTSFPGQANWSEGFRGPRILAKLFGPSWMDDFFVYTTFEYSVVDPTKSDVDISPLKQFTNLERISCLWLMTDQNLPSSVELRELDIGGSKITDAGMETIAHSYKLTRLDLWNTKITSRGVRYLESTPRLEILDISNNKIDDDAAETLGYLKNLRMLDLSRTKLTDKSVPDLGQLSRLKYLNISQTEVTEKGHQDLKAKLPDCHIIY